MANNYKILNRKSDFDFLKKKGKKIYPCDWMIINYQPNQLNQLRCGWVISRKVGKATLRNKLKRWCRTVFRELAQIDHKAIDINVILKEKKEGFYKDRKYTEFREIFKKIWPTLRTGIQKPH